MPENPSKSSWKTFCFFFESYPLRTIFVVLALLAAGLAETLGVTALLPLITLVIEGDQTADSSALESFIRSFFTQAGISITLETMLGIVVIMIALKSTIIFFTMRYVGDVSVDMARNLRLRLIRALMNARWSYFVSLPVGRVANAISEQAGRAGHCYMMAGQAMAALVQVVVYLGVAFFVSWQLSLLALLMGSLLAFSVKSFIAMARDAGTEMTSSMNDMLVRLNEALSSVKPLKAMGQQDLFVTKLEDDTHAVLRSQKRQYVSNLLLKVAYEPVVVFLMAGGLYFVLTQTQTPVSSVLLLAFLFYRLMGYANLTQNYYQKMVQMESAVWGMVAQSEDAEKQLEDLHGGKNPTLKKSISFNKLSLSYDRKNFIFKNFSDTIPAKKMTLLFGPSGIGKTTLIDAILGMHVPQSGEVYLDEAPLSSVDLLKWRRKTGYVPQETFLFHDSILQNVTLGKKYSRKKIENALRKAAIWDFVRSLPEGLDTIVGERGGRLSGGQRQRLVLARVLIREPELLILDEATTGLDVESEKLVLDSITALRGKTTVILISHNPALKKIADKVISLSGKTKSKGKS